ncbi:MAG TPA: SulP family inorganic anion transporter [Lacunisphaera sp.]|nr:SulP family inorganic anion transporter [Lacunisphaera sp.]
MRQSESSAALRGFQFRPGLLDSRGDRSRDQFRRDFGAELNGMVLALPLSIAFAIASGVRSQLGLSTAIVVGGIMAALDGSRAQTGGLSGALVRSRGILGRSPVANPPARSP